MAADPIERATNLLAVLLETRVPLTLASIMHLLGHLYPDGESTRRTLFERDKRLLRDQGVPIESEVMGGSEAGQTGYRIDRQRYELPELGLTADETMAVQVALSMVRSAGRAGDEAVWKLGGGGALSVASMASLPDLDALPSLNAAAASRSTVTFRYRAEPRTLDPYAISCRSGLWYLIGRDHRHDEVRRYRVDRIEGSVVTGDADAFERPADFDPRTELPTDARSMRIGREQADDSATIDEPDEAIVTIGARSARAVRLELGDEAVRCTYDDGSIDVAVACRNPLAFRTWLLGVDDAEVISPPSVRADFVRWLQQLVQA